MPASQSTQSERTGVMWPENNRKHWPLRKAHTRRWKSSEPETTCSAVQSAAMADMLPLWPRKTFKGSFRRTSQRTSAPSPEPQTARAFDHSTAMAVTKQVCPVMLVMSSPDSSAIKSNPLSPWPTKARNLPQSTARLLIRPKVRSNTFVQRFVAKSHMANKPASEPFSARPPSLAPLDQSTAMQRMQPKPRPLAPSSTPEPSNRFHNHNVPPTPAVTTRMEAQWASMAMMLSVWPSKHLCFAPSAPNIAN
mmetsp:Transcript_43437/g.126517  ORF Transcript_43437/g.126517 Transcript_43437/m.126517 type:complete len:250 (-) Transcript_43437:119-868(-)